jgi:hypothetical protein
MEVVMKISKLLLLISGVVLFAAFIISGCKMFEDSGEGWPEMTIGVEQMDEPDIIIKEVETPAPVAKTSGVAQEVVQEPIVEDFGFISMILKNPNGENQSWNSKTISHRAWLEVLHRGKLPEGFIKIKKGTKEQDLVLEKIEGGTAVKTKHRDSTKYDVYKDGQKYETYMIGAAGDIDGDGFGDFAVGAPKYDSPTAIDVGVVHLFFGGASLNSLPEFAKDSPVKIYGKVDNGQFGGSVAVGDANGDALYDVAVAAQEEDQGCVYIFHGRRNLGILGIRRRINQDTRICLTAGTDARFGELVFGDLNGDGFDDLIVGAKLACGCANVAEADYLKETGAVYAFMGEDEEIGGDNLADLTISTFTGHQRLGSSVAAGDIDGDGFDDLIVGAKLACGCANVAEADYLKETGAVYAFMGVQGCYG